MHGCMAPTHTRGRTARLAYRHSWSARNLVVTPTGRCSQPRMATCQGNPTVALPTVTLPNGHPKCTHSHHACTPCACVQACFKLLASLLRECQDYPPPLPLLRRIMGSTFADIGAAPAALFGLLRAVLSRKLLKVVEVYDVMKRVQVRTRHSIHSVPPPPISAIPRLTAHLCSASPSTVAVLHTYLAVAAAVTLTAECICGRPHATCRCRRPARTGTAAPHARVLRQIPHQDSPSRTPNKPYPLYQVCGCRPPNRRQARVSTVSGMRCMAVPQLPVMLLRTGAVRVEGLCRGRGHPVTG